MDRHLKEAVEQQQWEGGAKAEKRSGVGWVAKICVRSSFDETMSRTDGELILGT